VNRRLRLWRFIATGPRQQSWRAAVNVSRESLADLIAGRTVSVVVHDLDRFGRTVGMVEVDGRDVGLEQLQRGLAWVFERYISDAPAETQHEYREAQEFARSQNKERGAADGARRRTERPFGYETINAGMAATSAWGG
jgi:endonuclease YncB( thermonuclease family)